MRVEQTLSYPVSIFIAGDFELARATCQAYCDEVGLCVTVTPTTYVYTGGEEAGVIVGLINYPRFPSAPADILDRAGVLAARLREGLEQESYSIQTPERTIWRSWRGADNAQGIDTRQSQDGATRLGPKDESPVAESDAP